MDCTAARRALWPPEQPRIAGDAVVEAQRHVAACDACRDYLRQDRQLLDAWLALRRQEPSTALRERVFDALARERAARARPSGPGPSLSPVRRSAPYAGAAILALLVIAAILWRSARVASPDDDVAASVFIEDYVRRAVGEDRVETADPRLITRFLMRELGISVTPLQAEGLSVTGAEICLLDGRRGALIRHRMDGQTVSYYVVPREGTLPRDPVATSDPIPSEPRVVTWATRGLEHAIIAAAPAPRLLEIARRATRAP